MIEGLLELLLMNFFLIFFLDLLDLVVRILSSPWSRQSNLGPCSPTWKQARQAAHVGGAGSGQLRATRPRGAAARGPRPSFAAVVHGPAGGGNAGQAEQVAQVSFDSFIFSSYLCIACELACSPMVERSRGRYPSWCSHFFLRYY